MSASRDDGDKLSYRGGVSPAHSPTPTPGGTARDDSLSSGKSRKRS